MSRSAETYPLKPLLDHREQKVDEAARALAEAVRAREAAAAAYARVDRAKNERQEALRSVRAEESERLARGELRAVDLARAESFHAAAEEALNDLERERAAARARLDAALAREAEARALVAERRAEREVVATDEARFGERRRREGLAAEEEEAAEVWAAQRRSQ